MEKKSRIQIRVKYPESKSWIRVVFRDLIMLVFLYSPDPCPDLKKSLDSDADPIGKGLDPVKGGISRF